jgi:hypothetical protein
VHALFVITGRADSTGSASGCNLVQENFAAAAAANNLVFRIPTPVFGTGLMEEIADQAILNNVAANLSAKAALGISGRVNRNGNDGRISRFGWKAQNPSGLVFSGEAYNVEMGITNEAFQTERDETPECQFAQLPNDVTNLAGATGVDTVSAIEKFALFMRFLDQPAPSTTVPGGANSITEGRNAFVKHRLRPLPHARTPHRQRHCRRAPEQEREPVLRLRPCTTWGPVLRTTSPRAPRAATSSAPRRSGALANVSFSCMTGAPRTC